MPMTKFVQLAWEEMTVPLQVRKRRGSRRMRLTWQPLTRSALLTLPPHVPLKEGMRFVESRKPWLYRQIQATGERVALTPETVIPLLGARVRIVHAPEARGVTRQAECLLV
ncbi:MAG: DUF45 domain-containing protein, partial [Alphaproteobacteria bacterium]|nr:DUF45 domain-containing protein [Alphaproteobacteria bacterium]